MAVALRLLRDQLAAAAAAGRRPLLIVDEAHLIHDPATFETLRLLLNFATAGPARPVAAAGGDRRARALSSLPASPTA